MCKRGFEILDLIHDFAKFSGEFLPGLISGKFNNLIADNAAIISEKHFSNKDFVQKPTSLTDNDASKFKVAPVKDVVSIGSIRIS